MDDTKKAYKDATRNFVYYYEFYYHKYNFIIINIVYGNRRKFHFNKYDVIINFILSLNFVTINIFFVIIFYFIMIFYQH